MIERISSAAITATAPPASASRMSAGRAVGGTLVDALTRADPIGTPLRTIASDASQAVAKLVGCADPVGVAQIDRAVLDFAREAKAFAIGHADRGADAVRAALNNALAQGERAADHAPGSFNAGDHAAFTFAHASAQLQAQ